MQIVPWKKGFAAASDSKQKPPEPQGSPDNRASATPAAKLPTNDSTQVPLPLVPVLTHAHAFRRFRFLQLLVSYCVQDLFASGQGELLLRPPSPDHIPLLMAILEPQPPQEPHTQPFHCSSRSRHMSISSSCSGLAKGSYFLRLFL